MQRWLLVLAIPLVCLKAAIADNFEIFEAILADQENVVQSLIEADPQLMRKSGFGMGTPLHTAVSKGNRTIVALLITAKSDVNSIGEVLKSSPLDLAVQTENLEIARMLISAGANINQQNESGQTSLMQAISRKDMQLSKLLIESGADLSTTDKHGRSTLDYAVQTLSPTVVDLLLQNDSEIADISSIANSAGCIACHLPESNTSSRENRPVLNGMSTRYLVKQLNDFANGERDSDYPNQYKTNRLAAHSIGQKFATELSDYMSALPVERYAPTALSSVDGKAIYEEKPHGVESKTCSSCHGDSAQGNEVVNAPRLAGQEYSYIARELKEYRDGKRANDPQAQMRTIASSLSDIEIESIALYLSKLR